MKFKLIALASLVCALTSSAASMGDCPTMTVTLPAVEDAFARQNDPTLNYGGAGALAAAGPNALNGLGQPTGHSETVIKFNTSTAVTAFDTTFGPGLWILTSARLTLNEVGFPNNQIFTTGLGNFNVSWLSDDNWIQGTGRPSFPVVGAGQEMTWNLLQTILGSATEAGLGQFSNTSTSTELPLSLTLASQFVSDVKASGAVSIHVTPANDELGFVFNSSNYLIPSNAPQLSLQARSLRGDLNCDDLINLDDISAFVTALIDPAAYVAQYPDCSASRADMNADGFTNGADIPGFVAALLGC